MQYRWIDFLRTLVIGHGISIFVLTVIVLVRYAKVLMKKPHFAGKDRRVPWHILTLAISYFAATIFVCMVTVERLGQPLTWRLPMSTTIFILGNVGLYLIASYLKDQIDEQYRF